MKTEVSIRIGVAIVLTGLVVGFRTDAGATLAPQSAAVSSSRASASSEGDPDPSTGFAVGSVEDNAFRGRVVLNGFWRKRPVNAEDAEVVRVPEAFVRKTAGADGAEFEFSRTFTLPEGWDRRSLALEASGFRSEAVIHLDGVEIARVPANRNWVPVELPNAAVANQTYELKIVTEGIQGDIHLLSRPLGGNLIDDTYLTTSYRRREVGVTLKGAFSENRTGMKVVIDIREWPRGGVPVKRFEAPIATEPGSRGRWVASPTSPWENPRLWSQWTPDLYQYTVRLVSADGTVLDELLPRRFGFREVWFEDGRLHMNGNPLWVAGEAWISPLSEEGPVLRDQAEKIMRSMKAFGLNGGHVRNEACMDIADEIGMLLCTSAGSMVRLNMWNPDSGLTAMTGSEDLEEIERRVKRWREHPSLVLWLSNTAYSLASMHPMFAGRQFNSWEFFPANRNAERAHEAQMIFKDLVDFVGRIDPTREVGAGNSPFSKVEIATRYLGYNLDLQEREDFFEQWFRSKGGPGRNAIWVGEFAAPFMGHLYLRRVDHQMPHTGLWPKLFFEAEARDEGDEAYLLENDEQIMGWGRRNFGADAVSPVIQRLMSRNIKAIWQAWRTYGVSANAHQILCSFAFQSPVHAADASRVGSVPVDPRRPGLSTPAPPRFTTRGFVPMYGVDEITPFGETYRKILNPMLAYVGGPDGDFNSKDHLYFSGTPVRKAVIVVNDWDKPVALNGAWSFKTRKGEVLAHGELSGTVLPGRPALTEFPIEFEAPPVTARTDFHIEIALRTDRSEILEDRFDITVFPPHSPPAISFSGNIWHLNISDDMTHETLHFIRNEENQKFLAAAGVPSRLVQGLRTFEYKGYGPDAAMDLHGGRKRIVEGRPQPGDLLVIPRQTLRFGKDDRQLNLRLLENMGLDALIDQGLRVIVFEQDLDNVLGLQTEDVRPRRAFISAQGHPAFEGLEASDLSFWSGRSDLTPDMGAMAATDNEFPNRLWHVNSRNSVATRTIIRPQVGAARALAVSGFDLAEATLLEVTRGRGRILFCTMDVTSRYGKDPAATRLVDNLFRYITSVGDPDPVRNHIAKASAESDRGVELRKNVFRAAKPEGRHGWGITRGELFFRESIYANNWITRAVPEK
ncbi:MAG: hypothetical protein PHW08_11620, partial [Kiritimatiellae bacterium]|nr:hypothetical protein [Kiritimatiellia bacterium]